MNKYRDMDDATLVNLVLLGEEGVFDELVERYEDEVLEKAEQIVGNPFSVEDIAQDTFFSAWEHLSELRYPSGFRIWILRIAENRAKTLLRQYKSNITELVADMDSFPLSPENSLTLISAGPNSEKLQTAMNALNSAIQNIVRLYYIDGYSVREISTLLSIPEGTVWYRLHEGRKQLRRGFGVPEDGNDGIAARVRRQITAIKRWAEKNDKSGFAETYEYILPLVYQMEETPEKQKMLADVLLRGMWWIPGQNSEETFAKVKAAAIEGLNEEVMEAVTGKENENLRGEERVRFIRDKQIPELKEAGFKKTLGSLYFWLGYELAELGRITEALASFSKVISILPPSETYYACAVSALQTEKHFSHSKNVDLVHIACLGETYEKQNGKWIFINQYGYSRGQIGTEMDAQPMCLLSRCDGLIDDPAMKPGETRTSEDGKVTLMLRKADGPVSVPAGVYEDCLIYETKGESYQTFDVETVVCPGVGIVKQTDRIHGIQFLLTSVDVRGDGRIPFTAGNRWTYHAQSAESGVLCYDDQVMEIVYGKEKQVTVSISAYIEKDFDTATWQGNMLAALNLYCTPKGLRDVEPYLKSMETLAITSREKAHTSAAVDVMRRILRTDPESNPDYTERGMRNFFKILNVSRNCGAVTLNAADRSGAFEWKENGKGRGFFTILYNFLYEIVAAAWGGIWFDEWKPGFSRKKEHMERGHVTETALSVGEDETVTVTAGQFENCRHVTAEVKGALDYWSGHLEFWYAPGVGLVKFLRLGTAEDEEEEKKGPFVWELTEYRGTGEGYFPLGDGFLRRYEPANRPLPDGYRGWVEFTYSTDETGTVIFKNAGGVQERAAAEKTENE